MSRLEKIEPEHWAPELKAAIHPENLTSLEQGLTRFFAHCPDMMMGMMQFAGAMKTKTTLPERLRELVRLRIAFFNHCRSCMAIRYTDGCFLSAAHGRAEIDTLIQVFQQSLGDVQAEGLFMS